jgi:hypothetical protein
VTSAHRPAGISFLQSSGDDFTFHGDIYERDCECVNLFGSKLDRKPA